jgi:hypothetical protein
VTLTPDPGKLLTLDRVISCHVDAGVLAPFAVEVGERQGAPTG